MSQKPTAQPEGEVLRLLARADAALDAARSRADIGSQVPEMSRQTAVVRALARPFVQALLRAARIVTREQHAFNAAAIDALAAVREALQRTAEAQAKLAAEVTAAAPRPVARAPDTRGLTAYPHADFPTLTEEHLDNARLYADRTGLIRAQKGARRGVIAEVGVALGEFTEVMLTTLKPRKFYGIDLFKMHEEAEHWGRSSKEIFGDRTHRQLYEDRFGSKVVVEEGQSHVALGRVPDASCDLIYLDARHDYESVSRDARVAVTKLKPGGVLVFNDYIMFDHLLGAPYGVVQTVNEMVATGEWLVTGFALQQHMFCDIALRRRE